MQFNGVHISNIYETWWFIYGKHTCSSYETYMKNGPDIYADIYVLCKFPICYNIYVHICVIYGHLKIYMDIHEHICSYKKNIPKVKHFIYLTYKYLYDIYVITYIHIRYIYAIQWGSHI
jgi:hypothetical protein